MAATESSKAWPNPFYWSNLGKPNHAPTGWYEWTDSDLKFLGESILETDSREAGRE